MVDDDFDAALGEAISGQVGGDSSDADNTSDVGDVESNQKRKNVKNYPFYISEELRRQLDELYNEYDGKNKIDGGDGIEKHADFLEPIMRAAIEELDLDEIVSYEPED